MLLVRGKSFEGARVSTDYPGLEIKRFKVTAAGDYLLIWLQISPQAKAGDVTLRIDTPGGRTILTLPLANPVSTNGRNQGFNLNDVIYLIMPDRFADGDVSNDRLADSPGTFDRSKPRAYHGGDLKGIQDHLDYMRELGVTTLWLTPIVQNDRLSPQDYHGYGAVDEYAVNEHFGTLQDLQTLVASAHEMGLKVILDFVPNHVGPKHPWAENPPEPDWFHGTKDHHLVATGDFQYLADPHAPPRYWRNVVDGWFANTLPDLNQENPDVAQYFIQNALWWAEETGIDGYRLDTFPYVSRKFWSEWHEALREAFPRMTTVGEVFNSDTKITSFFDGGRKQFDGIDSGVTTVFDYPLYFVLNQVAFGDAPTAKLVDVLADDHLYPRPEWLVPFVDNHDVTRIASSKGATTRKVELAFSILLTLRGIPELYYGDEIAMTGGADPDNRRDFPGGFPGDPHDAFLKAGRTPVQQEMFSHIQELLRLRKESSALREGKLWNIQWDQTSYAFARVSSQEEILVVFNCGDASRSLEVSFADTPLSNARTLTPLLGGASTAVKDGAVDLDLAPEEMQVYLVK